MREDPKERGGNGVGLKQEDQCDRRSGRLTNADGDNSSNNALLDSNFEGHVPDFRRISEGNLIG